MADTTEEFRRILIKLGVPEQECADAKERWTTEELQRDFEVLGFLAPFVVVIRKSDGAKGSMMFQHDPRFYFNFILDAPRDYNLAE